MNIDWSKAPEGATHYYPKGNGYAPHWVKPGYFCREGVEASGWVEDWGLILDQKVLVGRPRGEHQEQTRQEIIDLAAKRCGISGDSIRQLATVLAAEGFAKFEIVDDEREQGVKELMDWVLGMGSKHLVRVPFKPFWEAAYDEGLRAPVKP